MYLFIKKNRLFVLMAIFFVALLLEVAVAKHVNTCSSRSHFLAPVSHSQGFTEP